MNPPNLYFAAAIGIFLSVLLFVAGYFYFPSRKATRANWEDLFTKLTWIDRNNIAQVALDLVDVNGQPKTDEDAASLEPSQLWNLIGGLDGLEVLERNSEVLIDLAFYVQRWYPEALPIAERLRLDARELKWHVARLRGAAKRATCKYPFRFMRSARWLNITLMSRRLLSRYEAANYPRWRI